MSRNLTVKLDDVTIHKAKVLAARRATSLSKFVAGEIERLVGEDEIYQESLRAALSQLEHGFQLGGETLPDRTSLHDR